MSFVKRAVSSSASQPQDLGKRRGKPIDGDLDRWGALWSRIASEPLLPRQAPMRAQRA
jgi:hypothetical protein